MDDDGSYCCKLWKWFVFILYFITIFCIPFSFIFLTTIVPVLMMATIMYGANIEYEGESIIGVRSATYFQSGLIAWWVVNFSIIYALGPNLSVGMEIVQIFYALTMIWFFSIISFKTIDFSMYSMILNPFVLIIGTIFAIILPFIFPCMLLWFSVTSWYSKPVPRIIDVPEADPEALQNANQDIHKIIWAIWSDPVFEDGETPASLSWGHLFHLGCIDRWIETRGDIKCPVDNRNTSRDQVLKVRF